MDERQKGPHRAPSCLWEAKPPCELSLKTGPRPIISAMIPKLYIAAAAAAAATVTLAFAGSAHPEGAPRKSDGARVSNWTAPSHPAAPLPPARFNGTTAPSR